MAGVRSHAVAPGIVGWLEIPAARDPAAKRLIVCGWAFATGRPIVEMWADAGGRRHPLAHRLRRDDVAEAYRNEPQARHSGFTGYLQLGDDAEGRVDLVISAALDDGRTVRLFRRRLRAPSRLVRLRRAVSAALQSVAKQRAERTRARAAARDAVEAPRRALAAFLTSGARLTFPGIPNPGVSAIVVTWNRAELVLRCLQALAAQQDVALELIVVDNASTDDTAALLDRLDGAHIVRHGENLGFTVAANAGARAATGEYLLFVNSDAEPTPGAIRHLLDTARRPGTASPGAVGGKLVFPDGRLQEAGGIIWADGSCDAYGRGDNPASPEYCFERPVDFCSAALLLTPRATFEELGGFDERYRPAYYEDADYCVRLWSTGRPVVYQPRATAVHHEFGSAASRGDGIRMQIERRPIFVARHASWLEGQRVRSAGVLSARSHPHGRPSVLVVDDRAPDPRIGAGFPRAAALVRTLEDLGYEVTIYATSPQAPRAPAAPLARIEIVAGDPTGLAGFLSSRLSADRQGPLVVVSRPHNMRYLQSAIGGDPSRLPVPCIYDAEAIFAERDIGERRLAGDPMTEIEARQLIEQELALARGASAVLAVSESDRDRFVAAGLPHVCIVGHGVDAAPTGAARPARPAVLFLGAFGPGSPNLDALRFFCGDIVPELAGGPARNARVVVAGAGLPEAVRSLRAPHVSWLPDVDDLDAPLRGGTRLRRTDALCGRHLAESHRGRRARCARGRDAPHCRTTEVGAGNGPARRGSSGGIRPGDRAIVRRRRALATGAGRRARPCDA